MKSEKTPKTCKKCSKPINELEFCDNCFIDVVFKRIRKFLRSKAYISKGDSILVIDELTRKVLPEIINLPINVKFKAVHFKGLNIAADFKISINFVKVREYSHGYSYPTINVRDYTKETRKLIETSKASNQKIIIPLCLDDIEKEYLAHIFSGKPTEFRFKLDDSIIPLFISLTKEELSRLAKLYHIKFVYFNEPINNFLDKLEQEFLGTKFNIKKSIF